jgi:uncharacterized DUF497 family protein
MEITFDPEKSHRNKLERGLSFERVEDFDFDTAIYVEDDRKDYGEKRIRSLGMLDGRLHALVFTMRGDTLRVISFRKAKKSEVKAYEEAIQ